LKHVDLNIQGIVYPGYLSNETESITKLNKKFQLILL